MLSDIKRVVILHGSYGCPCENWFPWLATEVRSRGHVAFVPSMPTPDRQNLQVWREEFAVQVGDITPDMILVGHSLAPAFILDLLERASNAVLGTYLVSGFLGKLGLEDFDKVNESFVCRDFDWSKIRENAGEIHIYIGNDDPYVPQTKGEELAALLSTQLTVIPGGGHINESAGYKSFPQLLTDLEHLLV